MVVIVDTNESSSHGVIIIDTCPPPPHKKKPSDSMYLKATCTSTVLTEFRAGCSAQGCEPGRKQAAGYHGRSNNPKDSVRLRKQPRTPAAPHHHTNRPVCSIPCIPRRGRLKMAQQPPGSLQQESENGPSARMKQEMEASVENHWRANASEVSERTREAHRVHTYICTYVYISTILT